MTAKQLRYRKECLIRTVRPAKAIGYLTTPPLETAKQNEVSMLKLLKQLASYNLTKLEKLQIVNLRPNSLVELYVVRFGGV